MKKYTLASFALLLVIFQSIVAEAQTNISGGIFANTVWDVAGSPYILHDSVVVFPGVRLTIKPGVTIKFDNNANLELRQGMLEANGTAANHIIFTSNSSSPTPGAWKSIYFNGSQSLPSVSSSFNFCEFYFGDHSILILQNYDLGIYSDYITIRNSIFKNNVTGLLSSTTPWSLVTIDSCNFSDNTTALLAEQPNVITNCTVTNNQMGIKAISVVNIFNCNVSGNDVGINGSCYDSIMYCTITNNHIGYENPAECSAGMNTVMNNAIQNNDIGILLSIQGDYIACNNIYGNNTYDLQVNSNNPYDVTYNYWGTTVAGTIESHIYDAHDNTSMGIATYNPFLSTPCAGVPYVGTTEVKSYSKHTLKIYPNPAFDMLHIHKADNDMIPVSIYDMAGKRIIAKQVSGYDSNIDVRLLAPGTYFIESGSGNNITRQIFAKE